MTGRARSSAATQTRHETRDTETSLLACQGAIEIAVSSSTAIDPAFGTVRSLAGLVRRQAWSRAKMPCRLRGVRHGDVLTRGLTRDR